MHVVCVFIPSELAWAVSVAPAGLSSSEVEDEEEEVPREWESLFRLRAGPVQLSKYLERIGTHKHTPLTVWQELGVFTSN